MISTEPGDVTVLKGETRSGFLSSTTGRGERREKMFDKSKIKKITQKGENEIEIEVEPPKSKPYEEIRFFLRKNGLGYKFYDDDGQAYGKWVSYADTDTDDPVKVFSRLHRDAMNTLAEIEREKGEQHVL